MTSTKTIKNRINAALRAGVRGSASKISRLVPPSITLGKLYEAYVLALVCERLNSEEGLDLTLVGSKKAALKSSPGPINNAFPHIRVERTGIHVANIWTDIEFTALSASQAGNIKLTPGEYHEIDVAVVSADADSRPLPEQVFLAVECKNTGYQKSLLREILGIRRELSYLSENLPTQFLSWPRTVAPARPPSCVIVYSTDSKVLQYVEPGKYFGIDFFHEPI